MKKIFLALCLLLLFVGATGAHAALRPLNEEERALVEAFGVYELMFSDAIDDGVFVWSDDEIAKLGWSPHTKIVGESRISYSWNRGMGDWGRGVGIADEDGVWIAEASAGTESASLVLLRDGRRIGGIDLPPSAVEEMEEQELFDQLEATRAGYSDDMPQAK